jgi:hypothetical protein
MDLVSEDLVVESGLRVILTDADEQLFSQQFMGGSPSVLRQCVICAAAITDQGGDFAMETMCSGNEGIKFSRPRIICSDCSELHAWKSGNTRVLSKHAFPLMKVYNSLKIIQQKRSVRSPVPAVEDAQHWLSAKDQPSSRPSTISLGSSRSLLSSPAPPRASLTMDAKELEQENRWQRGRSGHKSFKEVIASPTTAKQEHHDPFPFLETLQVVANSPSYNAGLRQGDLFIKFGPFTHRSFPGLEKLKEFIHKNGKKRIDCMIGRRVTGGDGMSAPRMRVKKQIVLDPKDWSQGVVLGCVLNTYPAPVPRTNID